MKNLDDVCCYVCKYVQNSEMFARDLFNIGIMDLYLLPCFYILLKRQLEIAAKIFMSETVLANLKVLVPINA